MLRQFVLCGYGISLITLKKEHVLIVSGCQNLVVRSMCEPTKEEVPEGGMTYLMRSLKICNLNPFLNS